VYQVGFFPVIETRAERDLAARQEIEGVNMRRPYNGEVAIIESRYLACAQALRRRYQRSIDGA